MAQIGFVTSLLGGLDAGLKRALTEIFQYILPNNRFGPVAHQTKSESFQAFYVNSTTAASTSEFSILHGIGRTPYVAVPVIPLDQVGAKTVLLTVSRAADAQRVYLKADAGSTNAPFSLLLE